MSLKPLLTKLNDEDRALILREVVILPAIEQDKRMSKEEIGNILIAGKKLGFQQDDILAAIDENLFLCGAVKGDDVAGFDARNNEDYEGIVARAARPRVLDTAQPRATPPDGVKMLVAYEQHRAERAKDGIPPISLHPAQVEALGALLESPPPHQSQLVLDLLQNRIAPGVDPAAKVKVELLSAIARGEKRSPILSPRDAVSMLGTMMGGFNVRALAAFLEDPALSSYAADALSGLVLVLDSFETVEALAKRGNAEARRLLAAWANAEWFLRRKTLPDKITVTLYKVDGETNTDDFSPAAHASTRPDIPKHALAMLETRDPAGLKTIAELKKKGHPVAFVGDVVGTGSSRKSAMNSLLWWIGEDIPFVPNKRRAGVVIGGQIAPIFFNTGRDSGALPIKADVRSLKTGMVVTIDLAAGRILDAQGATLTTVALEPETLADEYRAGGRVPLIIGRELTARARVTLGLDRETVFRRAKVPAAAPGKGYTLAQKMVGRACGLPGVRPGQYCEPRMSTVGSQDTTGPMTADEMMELACQRFMAGLVMQSFCHTAAYPKPADIKMFQTLPAFMQERGGVALKPGDGIIHSWLNRMLLPDTVGTGGDSHTRFPLGISFPAGSGLVAFGAALGVMPLDMPESVLVRFEGELRPGITLRDVVNAIPWHAIKAGQLTVGKGAKTNVFSGRILELEGLPNLQLEQAFELTDASAERSAEACTIALSVETVSEYLRSNVALLRSLIEDGYQDAETLRKRIAAMEGWLQTPSLLRRDEDAELATTLDIDLADVKEPILACPNDPDHVLTLSEALAAKGGKEAVHEVFIGSCMTNIGHYRAASRILGGERAKCALWICPPTRMDEALLREVGAYATFAAAGARTEVPGCSLCMGNQARVADNATVFSTSTRNFNNRMGRGAQVYLGSAEMAAIVSLLGRLPTPDEYFAVMMEKIQPKAKEVYRYLSFDRQPVPK